MSIKLGSLTNETAKQVMQAFLVGHADSIPHDNFDTAFYKSCTVRSATIQSPGTSAKATFHFVVPPKYGNQQLSAVASGRPQTSHGAALAVFFDITTSLAIIGCNFPGWESTGMSRRLDITYLRPPVEGDDVLIEAEVIQIGKRLAVLRGIMKRERDGVLLATCQHDKYMADKPHYIQSKGVKL